MARDLNIGQGWKEKQNRASFLVKNSFI